MKLLFTAALMLIASQVARSQAGSLDNSFGTGGIVVTDFGLTTSHAFGNAVAIQSDGKILVAGTVLARFNSDGTPDNQFGSGGIAAMPNLIGGQGITGVAIVIQNDGKILVAGTRFALTRFNSNGTLDTDFGTNGLSGDTYPSDLNSDWCHSMALQSDGKILLAGVATLQKDCRITRWMSNGTPDFSFINYGNAYYSAGPSNPVQGIYPKVYAHSVIALPDGKIQVSGYFEYSPTGGISRLFVLRLKNDGYHDMSFNGAGTVYGDNTDYNMNIGNKGDRIFASAMQSDGKILLAGHTCSGSVGNCDFLLVRLNANGSMDAGFGTGGYIITSLGGGNEQARSLSVRSDGKIVLAGTTNHGANGGDFAIAVYNPNGSLDNHFDNDGKAITVVNSGYGSLGGSAIQADGKIVLTGNTVRQSPKIETAILRCHGTTATAISSIPNETGIVYPNPTSNFITVENKNFGPASNYSILNAQGQQVLSGKLNAEKTEINISTLNPGIYLIQMNENGTAIKFIVNRN